MTIAENLIQDIQDQIQADAIVNEVSNTLPFAVLKVLGVVHNNTKQNSEDKLVTVLENGDFEFVSETLQRILNLLGWQPVVTQQDDEGSIIGLIPLGANYQSQETDSTESVTQGDTQAPGNSYE